MTANENLPGARLIGVDVHTLPSMLTTLRLPSFHKLWQEIATRADKEGWPAARFLAVLAESGGFGRI